eukprot:CAMPEP_0172519934 /NCGR_PEP_ID=MMETSP1066-20121228/291710_1 /TAXON_ID=671091 /ORGANISM="Coscinodiscus wailesii, Strain CCMP2513" /LENGTH=201 /DNA_ID=CAMNT_0013302609 /DNA_START=465 /DNA_END=1070 /DNA_ORIENTATION=-
MLQKQQDHQILSPSSSPKYNDSITPSSIPQDPPPGTTFPSDDNANLPLVSNCSPTIFHNALVGTPGIAPATTPQNYLHTVHSLAAVVSSTGLDRRSSLQLANESVLRRLESEFSRLSLDDVLERKDEERRRTEMCYERLADLAFKVFPGEYFQWCLGVATVVRGVVRHGAMVRELLLRVREGEDGNWPLLILERVCGCNDE